MKRKTYKRPNPFIYHTLGRLINLIAIKRGHKIIRNYDKLPDGPFIVLSNHTSFYDFAYLFRCCYPKRVNAVMARKYFSYGGIKQLKKPFKLIGKALFASDIRAIREMTDIIKQNGIIAMCPEGMINYSGITQPIAYGTGKFIKLHNLPIVVVKTVGAYFNAPPWGYDNKRKGQVVSYVSILSEKDSYDRLTDTEIEEKIYRAIYTDSTIDAKDMKFSGKNLTSGLESVLYTCPNCLTEMKMVSLGNNLKCSHCEYEVEMSPNGYFSKVKHDLIHDNISSWARFIEEKEKMKIEDKNYQYHSLVSVYQVNDKGKFINVGKGEISINYEFIKFVGTINNQVADFSIATINQQYVATDRNMDFQIYLDGKYTDFRPTNLMESCQIGNLIRYAHLFAKSKKNNN